VCRFHYGDYKNRLMENFVEEICTIDISTDDLQNIFMFFNDGTVVREYDNRDPFFTAVVTIPISEVEGDTREKILKVCPKEHLNAMRNLFNKYYLL
jgi:hypothetical protein